MSGAHTHSLTKWAWLSVGAAIVTIGMKFFAFMLTGSVGLLSDALESHERGRVQGASEALVSLASGAGSLGTGGVFAVGGMGAVASVGLAFSLALIAWAFWIGRRQSRVVVGESAD